MYAIYADGVCIYNDVYALDDMKVINPKLTLEDNAAGSLSMQLPPTNKGYDTIVRLVTDISVEKDGTELWAGRVLSESTDFWNNRTLVCEGELTFFNDSSQPQKEYSGLSVRAYMEALIEIHNSKVAANRQFTIGAVTITDDTFPTRYTNYEKTIELFNNLVDEYGGHLRVRKVNGVRYLDYLAEYPDTCSQVIQFGSNLIEFTRNWDSTEYATVIVPLGNRLDESPIEALDAYLTVESVNNGSMYVQSDEAVAAYGWIEKVVNWDDVSEPEELLEKAKAYLADLQFDNMEIELSALDLHYLDVDQEAVKLLDEIQVISRPHGLNRLFPVTKLEIPLDSPEKTQFTLGDTVQTSLTSVNNQINSTILQKIDGLPKAHSLLKEAQDNATQIMNMATTGYITIAKGEHGAETLYISNTPDYTESDKLWKWNMNGLGYSSDGGENFGLAITMDGAIVADYITAGVLNGDVIRAGTIQDPNANVIFDLDEGTLTIKKGSIDIGDGNFTVDTSGNMYARNGTFAGTLVGAKGSFGGVVQASDFLDANGNSMLDEGRFKSDYLSLYGLTIKNKTTEQPTFEVKSDGTISIGAGCTINWSGVTETNLSSSSAYNAAVNAQSAATDAQSTANNAYDAAIDAADAASSAETLAKRIADGEYSKGTFISGTEIYSPTIYADEFVVKPRTSSSGSWSGGYSMYGYFGDILWKMLNISYLGTKTAPYVVFQSPAGAYSQWNFTITYFTKTVDFSDATVKGLYLTFT